MFVHVQSYNLYIYTLSVEFKFTCLPGEVRLFALALCCIGLTQPAELPR